MNNIVAKISIPASLATSRKQYNARETTQEEKRARGMKTYTTHTRFPRQFSTQKETHISTATIFASCLQTWQSNSTVFQLLVDYDVLLARKKYTSFCQHGIISVFSPYCTNPPGYIHHSMLLHEYLKHTRPAQPNNTTSIYLAIDSKQMCANYPPIISQHYCK